MNKGIRNWEIDEERALQAEIRARLEVPHRRAKEIILRGGVKISGKTVLDPGFRAKIGEPVIVDIAPMKIRTALRKTFEEGIEILHRDRHVIVVHKPAGLLTVPTDEDEREICLLGEISRKLRKEGEKRPTLFIVQRLDRFTSGVISIARTPEARDRLKQQLKNRKMDRRYLAVSRGRKTLDEGICRLPLFEDPRSLKMRLARKGEDGKEAITRWKILEVRGEHSLVEAHLETGRRNQIRVHLGSVGLPIIGDSRYGVTSPWISRPALHAESLAFQHPITLEDLSFQVPFPADIERSWKALESEQ
ncbi:MAG: RluA family pseudouridine synthase [Planctomycetota bacterium]